MRIDYYHGTLDRARLFASAAGRAHADSDDAPDPDQPPAPTDPPADDTETREKKLLLISGRLNVKIVRIEKYLTDPPHYRLITTKAAIDLGEVGNLIDQIQFRRKIAAAAGRYMAGFDKIAWPPIAQLLLDVCEEIPVTEGTIAGRMREALQGYLKDRRPRESWDAMVTTGHPYLCDDHVVIALQDFVTYYNATYLSEQEASRGLAIKLKTIGAYDQPVNRRMNNGTRTLKRVWHLPPNFIKEEQAEDTEEQTA